MQLLHDLLRRRRAVLELQLVVPQPARREAARVVLRLGEPHHRHHLRAAGRTVTDTITRRSSQSLKSSCHRLQPQR